MAEFNSCLVFFCCNLLLQASESTALFVWDLRRDVREWVTTDTCEIKWTVRPNAALRAPVGTTCAAVLLVAALLLSTYLLNDWPAHVLERYVFQWYIWRPAQLSPPFVVRSVSYLCGKIFIMFLKIERKGARGETAVNYSRAQCETDRSIRAFLGGCIRFFFFLSVQKRLRNQAKKTPGKKIKK